MADYTQGTAGHDLTRRRHCCQNLLRIAGYHHDSRSNLGNTMRWGATEFLTSSLRTTLRIGNHAAFCGWPCIADRRFLISDLGTFRLRQGHGGQAFGSEVSRGNGVGLFLSKASQTQKSAIGNQKSAAKPHWIKRCPAFLCRRRRLAPTRQNK